MRPHTRGLLLTGAGALAITPDTLLIRLAEVDPWTMLFWRGIGIALGLSLFVRLVEGRAAFRDIARPTRGRILSGLLVAATGFSFVMALYLTAAANALVIIAGSPLAAAVLGRIVLGEPVRTRTWFATVAVAAGVAVILAEDMRSGHLAGDLLALAATVLLASYLVSLRAHRTTRVLPIPIWGNVLVAALVLPLAQPLSPSGAGAFWLALLAFAVLPVAIGLISTGPRYIPASEVCLLMLLETLLGPLWVWLGVGEVPARSTLAAGGVIVTALVVHSLLGLRSDMARRSRT